MTRDTALGIIRKACKTANPNKPWRIQEPVSEYETDWFPVSPSLADVLLAIGEEKRKKANTPSWSTNVQWVNDVVANWHLTFDSLEEQSDETLSFLGELLKQ